MNAPQVWQELGNTYLKLGAVDQAVSAYSKVVEPFGSDKERALGWRMVADLYLELNEPDLAADAFMQAAKLFVAQVTDEAPPVNSEGAIAEELPPPVDESIDQTPLEVEPPLAEAIAEPEVISAIPVLAEQPETAAVEQLPLGIPGFETIEPVSALVSVPVETEVIEAVMEPHPDQLELNLEAVATETAPEVEAVVDIETVDLQPDSVVDDEPAQVEVDVVAEPLVASIDEVALPSEAVEVVADAVPIISDEPVAELIETQILVAEETEQVEAEAAEAPTVEIPVQAVAESAPSESAEVQDITSVEMPTLVETESQLELVEETPLEASVVSEEVAPILEVVAAEQPAAESVFTEPEEPQAPVAEVVATEPMEEGQLPVAEVIGSEDTVVEEITPVVEVISEMESVAPENPVAEESVPVIAAVNATDAIASPVSEEVETQSMTAETEVIDSLSDEAVAPALDETPADLPVAEEMDSENVEPITIEPIEVSIDEIVPNPYVVLHITGMDELVDTVQKEGLTHPLIVTPNVWNNKYLLLVGEWRLEAARRAGLQKVPVLVRDVNPKEFLQLTLLQNAQQTYVNPLELAQLYQFLLKDFNLSIEAIAERVGRSPLAVENTLRLQNLTQSGQKALIEHAISEDHAQALLHLANPDLQDEVLIAIVENEMSIQRTIDYVSEINARDPKVAESTEQKSVIEIIVENDATPPSDVAWLEDNQPVSAEQPEATVESASTERVPAETPELEATSEPLTIIVDGDPYIGHDPVEPANLEDVPADNDGAYPIALPKTLAEIRKNVLMAWKLESEPFPAGYVAPAMTAQASGNSAVAVMSQVEQVATGRTIFLPDTNAILNNLNDQALSEAVVEVVIPVTDVVEPTSNTVQVTDHVEEASITEATVETVTPTEPVAEMPASEAAQSETLPRSHEEDAVAVYRRVTELNPTNDRAWHMLGNLLLDLGRLDEAVSALEVAISLNASRDIYYYHLGVAQAVQKNYGDAVQSFEKALALNPENIFAHCSIIGYYRKLGRAAEAEQHFQIVAPNIRLEKAYNRACFESICGNIDAALELLQQAIENDRVPVKWVERDPDLDLVRDDPRYKAMIKMASAVA